jgi:hypothetical protein
MDNEAEETKEAMDRRLDAVQQDVKQLKPKS